MKVTDDKLGVCEMEVYYDRRSTVDCYFEGGFSETLNRELTAEECEELQEKFEGDLQMHCWESGNCRNHN